MLRKLVGRLLRRRDGSVSIIGAISLPILIAMVGLVAEYGNGLLHKIEDQRVADAAAFAAATAYNANSGNSLNSVVQSVAGMNGVSASDVTESMVTSPSGDGNQAVKVTVSTQSPLLLSRILGQTATNLTVTATSYAEMKGGEPGCIIALAAGGTGVTLSGGTAVTASACAVASDNSVTVPCGTTITTVAVDYDSSSPPSEPCSGIQPPAEGSLSIRKTPTSDPLSGNSEVTTATARLATVAAVGSPSAPSTPTGTSVAYGYRAVTVPAGCSDSWNSSTSTHTTVCTGDGPFDFGNLTTSGGLNVSISATGSSPTFNFSSSASCRVALSILTISTAMSSIVSSIIIIDKVPQFKINYSFGDSILYLSINR